jgi:DNA polymerase-4
MRQANVLARLVSISFRTNEFFGCSHQKKLFNSTDCTDEIWEKYGSSAIFRSAFLNSGLHSITDGVVENEDYPMMTSLL